MVTEKVGKIFLLLGGFGSLPDAAVVDEELGWGFEVLGFELVGLEFPVEGFGVDPDFLFVGGDPAMAELLSGDGVDEATVDKDADEVGVPLEAVGVEVSGDFEAEAVIVFPDAFSEMGRAFSPIVEGGVVAVGGVWVGGVLAEVLEDIDLAADSGGPEGGGDGAIGCFAAHFEVAVFEFGL